VTAYKLRMRLLKVSCPRILSATNDPKHLLKKEIIGDVHYATVLFAQYCKHEIVLRHSTGRIFGKDNNRIAKTKWPLNCKEQTGCKITDDCPSGKKAYPNHRYATDE
jgi:hypothetical protein